MAKMKYYDESKGQWITLDAKDSDTIDGKHFTDIQSDAQAKATKALTDGKAYTNTEVAKKIDKTAINQPNGVAGLDQYGMIETDQVIDKLSQQPLSQSVADLRNHIVNQQIHVTQAKKNEWDAKATPTYVDNKIGILSDLQTANKTNLVVAVNESVSLLSGKVSKGEKYLNVKDFGAKGDGSTNDTVAIKNTVSNGGNIYIPEGTYMVDATNYINIPSNTNIELHPKAVLKVIPTSIQEYLVFYMLNVENVSIKGGKLVGERYQHLGTSGEYGHGIAIQNSKNIRIENITCVDFWGDGVFVDSSTDGLSVSKNISMVNVICDNNRRQGYSICGVNGLYMENCKGINTNGISPQAGIDFEPHYVGVVNENITLESCEFSGNKGPQILVASFSDRSTLNVRINNCMFDAKGVGAYSAFIGGLKGGNNVINSCVFKGETREVKNVLIQNSEIHLNGTHLVENGYAITLLERAKLINSNVHVSGSRKLFYAVGSQELNRVYITGCNFIYYDNVNPTNTVMDYMEGRITIEDSRILHMGTKPTGGYIFGADAINIDGLSTIINNLFVDSVFRNYFGWEGYVNYPAIQSNGGLTSPPVTGYYKKGDMIWNLNPTAGGYMGWVCIVAGIPGTWKGFGLIQA